MPHADLLSTGLAIALFAVPPAYAQSRPYAMAPERFSSSIDSCTITLALTNVAKTPLHELHGYLVAFSGPARIGTSDRTSFLHVPVGETLRKQMQVTGSPCANLTDWQFVITACRPDQDLILGAACATYVRTLPPLKAVGGY